MYKAEDGTSYGSKQCKLNHIVEVVHSPNKYLQRLYALINKSLCYYYQPINFTIEDGIVLHAAEVAGYIKSISLDEDEDIVHVTIFGADQEFNFPLYQEQLSFTKEAILQPAKCNVEGTHLFTAENCMFVNGTKIQAYIHESTPRLECGNQFRLQGVVLAAQDDKIYLQSGKIHRVYCLHDIKLNKSIDKLPEQIRLRISNSKVVLSGPLLINSKQYFIVHSMYRLDDYGLEFIVSTLENPTLLFKIAVTYATNRTFSVYLDGNLINMHNCGDYCNLMEVLYEDKQRAFTSS